MDKEEQVQVMCTYCHEFFSVDKEVADKLNETTAFCCRKCASLDSIFDPVSD